MGRQDVTEPRPKWGEAIVVGDIGSVAPWFLTGWAHEVEIEFMIDTGCQVTILSTTILERMCTTDPTVRSKLRSCRRRLVSADSSPLTVQGQLELAIVLPGLCCDMLFVVANIGSGGLLGSEALQSYLPHQLDLRTGQLWADGWSTLQLHQQRLTPELDGLLMTSVVIPPDSEIVAKFSVSEIRPHGCVLVEPARCLMEEYAVTVRHTLVDASSGSGNVLIVNPNAEVVVLPGCTLIGKLAPVAAISVAMEQAVLSQDGPATLPEYLEEIVRGSHPSLGDAGRQQLRNLLFRYDHVFPAPGDPVTGRTTAVQNDIITMESPSYKPATDDIRILEAMTRTRPYPGFSHRGRTICSRHGRHFVCCGGCLESATGLWGSGNRIHQPQPAAVSTAILYNLAMLAAVVMCTHFR